MPRNRPRPEPSAPPIHMMPNQNLQDYGSNSNESLRERSPPPRYEEAICDPVVQYNQLFPSIEMQQTTAHTNSRIPSMHSQDQQQQRQQQSRTRSSDDVANNSLHSNRKPIESRRRNSQEMRFRRRHSRLASARYSSASPSDLSDDKSDDDETNGTETGTQTNGVDGTTTRGGRRHGEQAKKRSSGSKIKRGLENIAFFIIQILD